MSHEEQPAEAEQAGQEPCGGMAEEGQVEETPQEKQLRGWKRNALILVLLAAIVGAYFNLIRGYRKAGVLARPMPHWVLDKKLELIDEETGKLITQTQREWEAGGRVNDRYKRPDTGRYTMIYPLVCYECGAKVVPPVDFTLGKKNYKCPKCGAPAMYCVCEEPPEKSPTKGAAKPTPPATDGSGAKKETSP